MGRYSETALLLRKSGGLEDYNEDEIFSPCPRVPNATTSVCLVHLTLNIPIKKNLPIKDLCFGLPNELETFLIYIKNLEFTKVPDYII